MYIICVIDINDNNKIFITNSLNNVINDLLPNTMFSTIGEIELFKPIMKKYLNTYGIHYSLIPNSESDKFSFLFYANWKNKNNFIFDELEINGELNFYRSRNKMRYNLITNDKINYYKVDEELKDISSQQIIQAWHRTFYAFNIPKEESEYFLN